jgi:2-(1,2-epoxy-1,2-dihydrophenyl)acetyl-CoA isomerase
VRGRGAVKVAGLVTELADPVGARGRELAGSLAAGAARAHGQTRRLLRAGWEAGRAATGAEEARTISEMVLGEEAQTLIRRFVEQ